ncbi:hypothetical protein QBC38DRAFT_439413 [Podospora fimiseda]|uniref:Uncharacterized protein n=1 Tax=Podospora fimiseda TaxID=252190 RepID=A0AAN7BZL9_9PEZI|nr:hypothetical protein QBC38DRAFT_439413 [Podospora fimiseda]
MSIMDMFKPNQMGSIVGMIPAKDDEEKEPLPEINPFKNPNNPFFAGPSTELDFYEVIADSNAGIPNSISSTGSSVQKYFHNPAKRLLHLDSWSRDIEKQINSSYRSENPILWGIGLLSFFEKSCYSPGRLTQELGWEPVPRGGLPKHVTSCGWMDAFEDLIRVNSGLEMRDVKSMGLPKFVDGFDVCQKRDYLEMGTVKACVSRDLLVKRTSQNLSLQTYLPLSKTPRSVEEWVKDRK